MATYFESGVGKAILYSDSANSAELGRLAATEALAQIKRFQPSLALAFVSPELDISCSTDCVFSGIDKITAFAKPRHSLGTEKIICQSYSHIWGKFWGQ